MDIPRIRLFNQRLVCQKFDSTQEAVEFFGAVQSQDFPAAKWSLGVRLHNSSNIRIEKAYNDGEILRTHIMRPTWHFVAPSDIRWMQKLTSGRVKLLMGHYNRKLELTDSVFAKSNSVITKALQNCNFLTRRELQKVLKSVGISSDTQRLAHLLMWAELEDIVTSGPMRGKQCTYALVDERIPKSKEISREESLFQLTLKYFQSHGPAQIKDFAWWSGLTMKDCSEGVQMAGSKLSHIDMHGITYYFADSANDRTDDVQHVFLLSVYDEYFIGYTDRSDILTDEFKKLPPVGNALLTSLVYIDGKVGGTWKRTIRKNIVEFKIHLFKTINKQVKGLIEEVAVRYAHFFHYESVQMTYV